jgi:hypothetical protein
MPRVGREQSGIIGRFLIPAAINSSVSRFFGRRKVVEITMPRIGREQSGTGKRQESKTCPSD